MPTATIRSAQAAGSGAAETESCEIPAPFTEF